MLLLKLSLIALLLGGCAARKNVGSPGRVVIPNECLKSINIVPETYCDKPLNGGKLDCHNATVTYDKACGPRLDVKSNKKEVKK